MLLDKNILYADGVTEDLLDGTPIRLADVVDESVVDGTGIRMTVFVQGCFHRCEGCHNPTSWSEEGGKEFTLRFLADRVKRDPLLDGCTFSGGEPFLQAGALSVFAKWLHEEGLNVWCYSGFTLEELIARAETDEGTKELLGEIDVLVDGRFEQKNLDLKLKFRGSSNQRVIDMAATRDNNFSEIVWVKGMR